MDKYIIDKLIRFGLITNVGIDASKYKDVDDLIAKGIITIPNAKNKIMELIGDDNIVINELPVNDDTVVNTPVETVVEDVENTIEPETEVVVEETIEETVETVVEDVENTIEPETEVVVEETLNNKSKKSKKN